MALVNMQMSAEEAKEEMGVSDSADNQPRYPYGLCIDLNDEALAKLGLTQMPAVGASMMVNARVVVTRTSAYQTQGNEAETSVGLQITDMELSGVDAGKRAAQSLYGN